jgi:hypothetical protein
MHDDDLRAALRRHWAASDANDFASEHQIYRADAVLEYPQSGERIRGRANIEASRVAQPSKKAFHRATHAMRRCTGRRSTRTAHASMDPLRCGSRTSHSLGGNQ